MVTGLVIDGTGFEVLAGGERIGSRRRVEPADVGLLAGLAGRYVRAVQAGSDAGVFVELGRELFGWLEGDQGQLTGLLERATAPVVFEVVRAAVAVGGGVGGAAGSVGVAGPARRRVPG